MISVHVVLWIELERLNSPPVTAILLTKRSHMTGNNPGYWGLPGGGGLLGESIFDTATRELSEELEVQYDTLNHLCTVGITGFMYTELLSAKVEVKEESIGYGLFTVEEVHHLQVCPEHRMAINEFIKKNWR